MQHRTPTPPYSATPIPRSSYAAEPAVAWWSNSDLITRSATAFAIAIGVLALVGWLVDVPELRALGPADRASMNPMTAAGFIALGSALWLVSHEELKRSRQIVQALATLVLVVGAARLYAIASG